MDENERRVEEERYEPPALTQIGDVASLTAAAPDSVRPDDDGS
jgi:hypothetical protein